MNDRADQSSEKAVGTVLTTDLERTPYAPALELQRTLLDEVLSWRDEPGEAVGRMLLLEHDPPVITVSRRQTALAHLVTPRKTLEREGIEIHETDRGGDITYHGPGQLVVYPILDLNRLGLNLHGYMRLLEEIVIRTCARFGVTGERDECATGVWIPDADGGANAKICAIGVRVRRWISMHGLALNVSTNLAHFQHIVPCGLAGRPVTSLQHILGDSCPTMVDVKRVLAEEAASLMNCQVETIPAEDLRAHRP